MSFVLIPYIQVPAMARGRLFVVSAPSGAGKTTLVEALLNTTPVGQLLQRVVTYTSRLPRSGEVEGRDYHFVSPATFEALIKDNFFLEWSATYGAYYGSPTSLLEGVAQGQSYIMILDWTGAGNLKKLIPEALLVRIQLTSMAVLRERLLARATDSAATIEKRLALAEQEFVEEEKKKMFDFYILNDFFPQALAQFATFVESVLNSDMPALAHQSADQKGVLEI